MPNPDQWAAMQEFITGLVRKLHENSVVIATRLKKFEESAQKFVNGYQNYVETTERLFSKVKDAMEPLIERGWFISGYFGKSELEALGMQREKNDSIDNLERLVVDMYRNSVNEHMRDLIRDYPQRAFAIKPAVDAHSRGEYALSVPLFFAQADGICFEAIDKYIFMGKGNVDNNIKGAAMKRLESTKDSENSAGGYRMLSTFVEIMWGPFSGPLPVAYNQKERDAHNYTGLNRHTIMHGLAPEEYATEENSLRAFSMLSHIGALMHDLAEQERDCPWMQNPP